LRLHICLLAEQMCLLCPGVEAGQRVFEQQGENNSSLSCRHTLPPTAILLKGRKNTLLQGRCMLSEPNTYQVLLAPHHPAGLSSGTVLIPSRSAKLLSAAGRIGQVLGSGMHLTTMQAVPFAPPLCFLHVMQKPLPSSPTSTNHPAGLSSGTVLIPSRSAKLLVAPQVRPQALSAYSLRIRQTALVWRAQHTSATNPMRQCALPAFLRNPTNCPPSHPTRKVPQCRRRSI
jgi:hypothetical protein